MEVDLDKLIAPWFDQYPDEWLLFEVTETDETGWPTKVRFVAHDPSRERIADIAIEQDLDDTLTRFAGDVLPKSLYGNSLCGPKASEKRAGNASERSVWRGGWARRSKQAHPARWMRRCRATQPTAFAAA